MADPRYVRELASLWLREASYVQIWERNHNKELVSYGYT